MARIALVHGLGGTAATMQPLADELTAGGYECDNLDVPGDSWNEWLAAIPDTDVLVGQSLGAALALAAAPHRPHVRAVVAINPPTIHPDAVEGLEWRRSRGHEWVDDQPISAVLAMANGVLATDLSAVRVPVLLVTSAHDETAEPAAIDAMAASIGGEVTRLVLPTSGHSASLGPDLELLAGAIATLADGLT